MEEYIADLQEQLITAQHRFMKMHRDMKKVHLYRRIVHIVRILNSGKKSGHITRITMAGGDMIHYQSLTMKNPMSYSNM